MTDVHGPRVEFQVHFATSRRGKKRAVVGERPPSAAVAAGRLPRITRLMALAIRFEQLIRDGEVRDFADIARLGQVTRARVTQIMNLLHLAPDIQEEILSLPRIESGGDPFTERELRPIAAVPDWRKQRVAWADRESRSVRCSISEPLWARTGSGRSAWRSRDLCNSELPC